MYKQISLDDPEVFEFVNKKTGWTFKYFSAINTQKTSHIPVYTATLEPVAYVDIQTDALIDASHEHPILSFGANGDGSAGTNFVLHERPFYVSNDRTCIKIVAKNIDPQYVIHQLSTMKRDYGFDFQHKAVLKNLRQVSISIPVTEEGEFDHDKQVSTVAKLKTLAELQNTLSSEARRLKRTNIVLNLSNYRSKEVSLSDTDCFSLFIGRRLLKQDMLRSGIPVYSANVEIPFGYVKKSNIKDFSRPALLWGIDWIYNWAYIPPHTDFATTDHCGVVWIKRADIDPKYVFYALKTTKDQYGFDRIFRASLKNVQDVVSLQIPVLEDGSFDMKAQIELANRYEKLNQMKRIMIDNLSSMLSSVQVNFDDGGNR
jgi:hypothetical protein